MKSVSVLLSTYNGSAYIQKQIESILQQLDVNVRIFVRDDGSRDNTRDIIKKIAENDSRITTYFENNIGYTRSFFKLCQLARNTSDYYAFCDQDDIWLSDKLISAVTRLENESNSYKLYFSNLTFVNENLTRIGEKKYNLKDINFNHAMIRNSVAGCTMVFNNNLNSLGIKSNNLGILSGHDAWFFRLNLAIGGATIYEHKSHILFRRYGNNTTAAGTISLSRMKKELNLKRYESLRFNTANILAVDFQPYISKNNQVLINNIINYKKSWFSKFKLLTDAKFSYSFIPIMLVCKLQILFNEY